jgi:VanZ family protein
MKNLLKRKTIIMGILCIIWLVVIFYNGTRQGEVSQRISKEGVKVISMFMDVLPTTIESNSIKFSTVNFYVRKNAHFFQYLILSILICAVVKQLKLYKSSKIFLVLFLILLFPVADEFIQKYIPGRTSSVFDIIIDFSGGVLGMLIYKITSKISHLKT